MHVACVACTCHAGGCKCGACGAQACSAHAAAAPRCGGVARTRRAHCQVAGVVDAEIGSAPPRGVVQQFAGLDAPRRARRLLMGGGGQQRVVRGEGGGLAQWCLDASSGWRRLRAALRGCCCQHAACGIVRKLQEQLQSAACGTGGSAIDIWPGCARAPVARLRPRLAAASPGATACGRHP